MLSWSCVWKVKVPLKRHQRRKRKRDGRQISGDNKPNCYYLKFPPTPAEGAVVTEVK